MRIPKGITINATGEWVLRVKRNIYGQKQAGRVWNEHLVRQLTSPAVGFVQSQHDKCIFYHGRAAYVLYTDDSILAGPDEQELNEIIRCIKAVGLDITEEGALEDFLGIHIDRIDDTTYHLSQPQLIDQIIQDLHLNQDNVTTRPTPATHGTILGCHIQSPAFDGHFHYWSVIGKLNHLERGSRSDIAYAVHQCARFSSNPRKEHGEAVKRIGRYLKGTRDRGFVMKPTDDQFRVWADADFSGNWIREESTEDSSTARSRTGYIIAFLGCPILWKSQIQTEIALRSCESEYIALSQALRTAIPIMNLIQEMKDHRFHDNKSTPTVHCTLFEDNSGALTLAKAPAMRPRTKHINIKYHHFHSHVANGTIDLQAIRSENQPADILTKPLTESVFVLHRHAIMGRGNVSKSNALAAKCLQQPPSRQATAMAVSSSLPAGLRGSAGIPPGMNSPAYSGLSG
jgi:hypothetical protein